VQHPLSRELFFNISNMNISVLQQKMMTMEAIMGILMDILPAIWQDFRKY
jgi:hypothetical protein